MSSSSAYAALRMSSITRKPWARGARASAEVQDDLRSYTIRIVSAGRGWFAQDPERRSISTSWAPVCVHSRPPPPPTTCPGAEPAPVPWAPSSQHQQTPRLALGALLLAEAPRGLTPLRLCCRGAPAPGVPGVQMKCQGSRDTGGPGRVVKVAHSRSRPLPPALLQGRAPGPKLSGALGPQRREVKTKDQLHIICNEFTSETLTEKQWGVFPSFARQCGSALRRSRGSRTRPPSPRQARSPRRRCSVTQHLGCLTCSHPAESRPEVLFHFIGYTRYGSYK